MRQKTVCIWVWSPQSMSGLAESFGFSAIGLASGHRKWMLAHSIRDWLHCIRGLSFVMHGSSYCSVVFDPLLRLLEEGS